MQEGEKKRREDKLFRYGNHELKPINCDMQNGVCGGERCRGEERGNRVEEGRYGEEDAEKETEESETT